MADLTLVQFSGMDRDSTFSPLCGKVLMALRFKALKFKIRRVFAPWDVQKYNSRGRVPALLTGESVIVDSTDIVTYLEQVHPDRPLLPADERLAQEALWMEDWSDESLYFYSVYLRWWVDENFARFAARAFGKANAVMRPLVRAGARREAMTRLRRQGVALKGTAVVRKELEERLDWLESRLQDRDYLVGESLTRADLAVCAVLDQLLIVDHTPEEAQSIRGRGALSAWLDRVHEQVPASTHRPRG